MKVELLTVAVAAIPAFVLSGVGMTACRTWVQTHEQEPPMGTVWQLAVACTVVRTAAAIAELVALIGLLAT